MHYQGYQHAGRDDVYDAFLMVENGYCIYIIYRSNVECDIMTMLSISNT